MILTSKRLLTTKSKYAFREINKNNISSFINDLVYLSSLTKFNDPYEGLLRYDLSSFRTSVNPDIYKYLSECYKIYGKLPYPFDELGEFQRQTILNDMSEINGTDGGGNNSRSTIDLIRPIFELPTQYVHENVKAACFSEDVTSILMWSHYNDEENDILLPVSYSSSRLFLDDIYKYIAGLVLGIKNNEFNKNYFPLPIALVKGLDWSYEREWRLINLISNKDSETNVKLEPDSIYYGSRISKYNKSRLHNIAKKKGLKEYEMTVDFESDKFVLNPLEI